MQKRIRELEMENEILKKATAIFRNEKGLNEKGEFRQTFSNTYMK